MGLLSVLSFAQQTVKARVRPGEPVVDATMGGGNDTAFLARCTGRGGRVYAFDVQSEALAATRARLAREGLAAGDGQGPDCRLLLCDHADMERLVEEHDRGRIAAVMFNLGYLPGSDRQVITRPKSSLAALEAAFRLLRAGGVLSVVLYPGHPGGEDEAEAVERWAAGLPEEAAQVMCYRSLNRRASRPPYLIMAEKKAAPPASSMET